MNIHKDIDIRSHVGISDRQQKLQRQQHSASGDDDDWLLELAPARLQPITYASAAGADNVAETIITQHLQSNYAVLQ